MLRILPEWPATAAAEKPGRSVVLISAVASPSASTAGSQPEPSTSATSCWATPVRSARAVAASAAAAYGSVTGETLVGANRMDGFDIGPGMRSLFALLLTTAGLA